MKWVWQPVHTNFGGMLLLRHHGQIARDMASSLAKLTNTITMSEIYIDGYWPPHMYFLPPDDDADSHHHTHLS
jgi:hypothetical protein